MKKFVAMILLAAMPALAGPWVAVSVNTNTWECKPYWNPSDPVVASGNGTNYWNSLGSGGSSDTTPPTIIAYSPIDGATSAGSGTDLIATFSETIVKAIGNITITNITDGTYTNVAIGSANAQVSGPDLTVTPPVALLSEKDYAVMMDAGVVEDSYGNDFAGILNATTWNFTTAEAVPDAYSNALFYLSFPQDESPLIDQSTSGNDFTESSTTWGSHSISLTSADSSYIAAESTGIGDGSEDFTMSFWIKYNSAIGSYDALLNAGASSSFPNSTIVYMENSTTTMRVFLDGKDTSSYNPDSGSITHGMIVGTWYHIVVAYQNGGTPNTGSSNSDLVVYINNVVKFTTATAYDTTVGAADTWYFGYNPDGSIFDAGTPANCHLDASIDDVSIIPAYWDATTVSNVYTAGRSE